MQTIIKNLLLLTALIAALGLIPAGQVEAQTFTNLHNFAGFPSDGVNPDAGLILSGKTLYGAAASGGKSMSGTLFAVNTDGSDFTNLYSFTETSALNTTNSDGAFPSARLVLSGSILYGTAPYGGTNGNGTVFTVNTNGLGFTILHTFSASYLNSDDAYTNGDGANPNEVILSGNTLYGTTFGSGTNGCGTIFAINTDGTDFTNLHNFGGFPSDGAEPLAGLILSGNTLYGTTIGGGSADVGTVFKINTDGTDFTNMHNFGSFPSDGANPYGGLILSGNTLYGAAVDGGTNGSGTVFAVNTDGTDFTNLHIFSTSYPNSDGAYTNSDGLGPQAGFILSGNTLYGTTSGGGTNGNGTVFAINTDGTNFMNLYNFTATLTNSYGVYTNSDGSYNGYIDTAELVLSGNTLYGTTEFGGINGDGTVFSLSLESVSTPVFQSAKLTNGQFMLTWSAVSNDVYQLQYKTNLTQANWINIGGTITASNTVLSATSATGSDQQRFYRVQQQ